VTKTETGLPHHGGNRHREDVVDRVVLKYRQAWHGRCQNKRAIDHGFTFKKKWLFPLRGGSPSARLQAVW
jgi:hypothetical protein